MSDTLNSPDGDRKLISLSPRRRGRTIAHMTSVKAGGRVRRNTHRQKAVSLLQSSHRLRKIKCRKLGKIVCRISGIINAVFSGKVLAVYSLAAEHPDIRFHITSGDTQDLMNELNNGLIDFAVIFTEVDHQLYQSIELPVEDSFGLLMPKDCSLAEKEEIRLSDIKGLPVIVSRGAEPYFTGSKEFHSLNIIATYNLVYNASLLVEDGLGYAICFDKLINTTGDSRLCMRPIIPQMTFTGSLIWKKYQGFSPAVQMFIDRVRNTIR